MIKNAHVLPSRFQAIQSHDLSVLPVNLEKALCLRPLTKRQNIILVSIRGIDLPYNPAGKHICRHYNVDFQREDHRFEEAVSDDTYKDEGRG